MKSYPQSAALFDRARAVIPGGVNSPVRAFKSVGGTPVFMKSGSGCYLTDVDGNTYIDYCGSWGPLISGHAHPEILKAVMASAQNGTSFGTPNPCEVEIASLITGLLPHAEMIRFVNSGTEAVMSAIRVARGFTGRTKIIKFDGCYHGHADSLLVNAGSGLATFGIASTPGVPESLARETLVLPLDDEDRFLDLMKSVGDQVAAVIIEPVPANNGLLLQRREFLQTLRDACTQSGALLIFDEVISGFRVALGGATGVYDIRPDLVTFGKIIGGGFPVGAYAGRRDIMSVIAPVGKVYQAGTLSGNPVAMAAGLTQLRLLTEPGFYDRLESLAARLGEGMASIIRNLNIEAVPIRMGSVLWTYFGAADRLRRATDIDHATMDRYRLFFHHCLENGVYIAPSGYEVMFVSSVHQSTDLDRTLTIMESAFKVAYGK
ncbi:MAG: glutamate-1-semialdehyde 2,1-aminomutase [Bacteroidetes bacterium]|nr:glutamate-1-semialdehyde 2,1-aminomutase [Bacteroidota bacterium]